MFVGIGRYELFIPDSRSLKDKRQVLRSVTQNVKNKLHVAVAEVAFQDKWQRAVVGVSCVAESPGQCSRVLQEAEKVISRAVLGAAEITDRETSILSHEDLL